jgi:hypothetical protein
MNYIECRDRCIATIRADGGDGSEDQIAIYTNHPFPTEDEWADIVIETARYDDVHDPFACMGQYEMHLHRSGRKTALGAVVEDLKTTARNAGIPEEYLSDAVTLLGSDAERG